MGKYHLSSKKSSSIITWYRKRDGLIFSFSKKYLASRKFVEENQDGLGFCVLEFEGRRVVFHVKEMMVNAFEYILHEKGIYPLSYPLARDILESRGHKLGHGTFATVKQSLQRRGKVHIIPFLGTFKMDYIFPSNLPLESCKIPIEAYPKSLRLLKTITSQNGYIIVADVISDFRQIGGNAWNLPLRIRKYCNLVGYFKDGGDKFLFSYAPGFSKAPDRFPLWYIQMENGTYTTLLSENYLDRIDEVLRAIWRRYRRNYFARQFGRRLQAPIIESYINYLNKLGYIVLEKVIEADEHSPKRTPHLQLTLRSGKMMDGLLYVRNPLTKQFEIQILEVKQSLSYVWHVMQLHRYVSC